MASPLHSSRLTTQSCCMLQELMLDGVSSHSPLHLIASLARVLHFRHPWLQVQLRNTFIAGVQFTFLFLKLDVLMYNFDSWLHVRTARSRLSLSKTLSSPPSFHRGMSLSIFSSSNSINRFPADAVEERAIENCIYRRDFNTALDRVAALSQKYAAEKRYKKKKINVSS